MVQSHEKLGRFTSGMGVKRRIWGPVRMMSEARQRRVSHSGEGLADTILLWLGERSML